MANITALEKHVTGSHHNRGSKGVGKDARAESEDYRDKTTKKAAKKRAKEEAEEAEVKRPLTATEIAKNRALQKKEEEDT